MPLAATALALVAFACLAFAPTLPASAGAKAYYVSPGGSDSRPCDLAAAPCRTISQALLRAKQQPGAHTVNVAARHNGDRAVYRESIDLRQGSSHRPRIVVDGSWQGGSQGRALVAPRGAGAQQVVLLGLPGATVRNLDVDSSGATSAAAAVVMAGPGTDQVVTSVKVTARPGSVGVVVGSASASLQWVEVDARDAPALDYSAPGDPVMVQDSVLRQNGTSVAIRGGGTSSLVLRRSMAMGNMSNARVVTTEGGRLFLDSALVSGGNNGAIHLGGPTGPSLRAVSSTIDTGASGVSDSGLAAVTLATGGNAEVDIIGSILLEPPLITVAGAATIRCSHTDIPSTVVEIESPPQSITCGSGVDGNSHSDPKFLFSGSAPFTQPGDYRLRAGSSAVNTGPNPAPADATPFDLAGEARIQPPGTCAEQQDVIDKGAYEYGCRAAAGAPRPPNLRETLAQQAQARTPQPVIGGARAVARRLARGRPARILFRLNTPARVLAVIAGRRRVRPGARQGRAGSGARDRQAGASRVAGRAGKGRAGRGRAGKGRRNPVQVMRIRRVLKQASSGRNLIALPTRRLRARGRPYRVRLIARGPAGLSKPVATAFRVLPRGTVLRGGPRRPGRT